MLILGPKIHHFGYKKIFPVKIKIVTLKHFLMPAVGTTSEKSNVMKNENKMKNYEKS